MLGHDLRSSVTFEHLYTYQRHQRCSVGNMRESEKKCYAFLLSWYATGKLLPVVSPFPYDNAFHNSLHRFHPGQARIVISWAYIL